MRTIVPLNFDWYFSTFQTSHLKKTEIDEFERIHIPHNAVDIPFNHFNEKMIESVSSYVKHIDIDKTWEHKVVRLLFEGVAHQAKIYINHLFVAEHTGGYTAFEVDISTHVNYGVTNEVLVVTDSHENPQIPPFGGVVDYLGYSGIYREVSLIVTDQHYIKHVFVQSDGSKKVSIDVSLSKNIGDVEVTIQKENKKIVAIKKVKVTDVNVSIDLEIEKPILWDLNTHYLYEAVITYYSNSHIADEVTERFGIRKAEFTKDGFYLNGEHIKLIGLNRHQSYPYVGYAMPKSAQYEDADILKYQLGLNIVRTSHYPQSKHFLNRCDEIGLLVFEEIPGWQHIGDEQWQENSCEHLKDMIIQDRNHPSIVLWGVRINESPDHHDFYFKTNGIARSLDPSRQTAGVRNIQHSEFLEDVYTYNDFSHRGNNKGLKPKKKITKNVPYLVTEFNGHMYPTKRYDDESHQINHMHRHLKVLDAMMEQHNGISGSIGWCMADYNTHQEFGSGDRVCYHGVLDMFRNPKLASYAYASQEGQMPILKVASDMQIGEYPAGELPLIDVVTNLEYVKLYKNEDYIGTFYPDHKRYPNLKHPPIVIDDFIGETLMKNENMSYKDAELTKDVLKSAGKYGNNLPLRYKLKILYLLKKYKMSYDEGIKMFFRYMSGWGSTKTSYRFEGYQNDILMKTVIKENNETFEYVIDMKQTNLHIDQTYDVGRITVQKVNQNHIVITNSFDPVDIKVKGSIELIGPNKISLHGGIISFWVKTKSRGKGHIEVCVNEIVKTLEVNVS